MQGLNHLTLKSSDQCKNDDACKYQVTGKHISINLCFFFFFALQIAYQGIQRAGNQYGMRVPGNAVGAAGK